MGAAVEKRLSCCRITYITIGWEGALSSAKVGQKRKKKSSVAWLVNRRLHKMEEHKN